MSAIAEDLVREQVSRISSSKEFENSERLCRFLQFSVESLLRGEQDQVKEYLIGKMVFDRNQDYDPRIDPIVRVEARRLRKKLDEYYAGAGVMDAVRIQFPKGSYVPEVQMRDATEDAAGIPKYVGERKLPSRWIPIALGCLVLGAIAGVLFWKSQTVPQNTIAVVPARWIWPNEDLPALRYDEDLSERISMQMANRYHLPVISWPLLQKYRGRHVDSKVLAKELGINRIVLVAVRVESDGLRVTSYVIEPLLGRKLKVSDKRSFALAKPEDREKAAEAIAGELSENP